MAPSLQEKKKMLFVYFWKNFSTSLGYNKDFRFGREIVLTSETCLMLLLLNSVKIQSTDNS